MAFTNRANWRATAERRKVLLEEFRSSLRSNFSFGEMFQEIAESPSQAAQTSYIKEDDSPIVNNCLPTSVAIVVTPIRSVCSAKPPKEIRRSLRLAIKDVSQNVSNTRTTSLAIVVRPICSTTAQRPSKKDSSKTSDCMIPLLAATTAVSSSNSLEKSPAEVSNSQTEGPALMTPLPVLPATYSTTVGTCQKRLRSHSIEDCVPSPAKRPSLATSSTNATKVCVQVSNTPPTLPKVPTVAISSLRKRVLDAFYCKPVIHVKESAAKSTAVKSFVHGKGVGEGHDMMKKVKPAEKVHKKEDLPKKEDSEEKRRQLILDNKKKREERLNNVALKQAALKVEQEEKKKKTVVRVEGRANQLWQKREKEAEKREKEAEDRKRRMKERMAAAELRRKQEAETLRKKLQQLEDDKRMAARLAEQRKEVEEEEKRIKRLEKQRNNFREKEAEAKGKLKEEEILKKKMMKARQAKPQKEALELDLANQKKDAKLRKRLEVLMAKTYVTPGTIRGLGGLPSPPAPPPPQNLNQTFVKTVHGAAIDVTTSIHFSLSSADLSVSGGNEGVASYEMTPLGHDQLVQRQSNYDIADLSSDDTTDDEDYPKKSIPRWAQPAALQTAMLQQKQALDQKELDLHKIFPPEELLKDCNLSKIFNKKTRKCFYQRSSSANWNSPVLKDKFKS